MFILKFLISKNIHLIENSQSSIDQIIAENLNLLYINSKYFNDHFTRTLIEKSKILDKKFVDKTEIFKEFNITKKQTLFSIFFKNHVILCLFIYNTKSIFQFVFANLVENTVDFWINNFNPNYHMIYSTDSDVVKKIKALSFIHYYLKNDNYPQAFSYFDYLGVIKSKLKL